jgi:N-acetyl sugar amidotransferase
MDTSDPDIEFDSAGVCNHCHRRDRLVATLPATRVEGEVLLGRIVARIKEQGLGKDYDCLLGISGGVDSSYLAHLAVGLGLRPLVVHFDNGWNSELAVKNIESVISKLGLDLQTYVVDWEEFRDIQRSLLKAGVLDLEILSDQAIIATMFRLARKNGIKYILSGHNVATETHLPDAWTWMKFDARNIRAIQRRFGTRPIRSTPLMGILGYVLSQMAYGFKFVWPLNLVHYDKREALALLKEQYGWREYSTKHGESIITRFYQNYILPTKFGVDKRRAHLSSLICSGALGRDEAMRKIGEPPYTPGELEEDLDYVTKKLGFSRDEFDAIMKEPVHSHLDYPSEYGLFLLLRRVKRLIYGDRLPVVAD